MSPLSEQELKHLREDLTGLKGSLLVGVLVGDGSMVLNFSCGSSILVQCPFETHEGNVAVDGHGEEAKTSVHLFKFLNTPVDDAAVTPTGLIKLRFGPHKSIRILPDLSGLESYVLRTAKGVFPVY